MPEDIPAGWYPHPDRAGLRRWWDGAGWTEHISPEPPQQVEHIEQHRAEPAQPHAYAQPQSPLPAGPQTSAPATYQQQPMPYAGSPYNANQYVGSGGNSAAIGGFIFGLVALLSTVVFSRHFLLLAFIATLTAIIWSSVGLSRASKYKVGTGLSVTGLVLGIISLVFCTIVFLAMIS